MFKEPAHTRYFWCKKVSFILLLCLQFISAQLCFWLLPPTESQAVFLIDHNTPDLSLNSI